jgi:alkanesulfonate monooxygenase SsuD/methylene tetrahydromethanopterin reductase-like flavin-dependent oxidoreductase (luciferase family)
MVHDARYHRADEFMAIVLSCWEFVGGRRAGRGQGRRVVCAPRQGASARIQRPLSAIERHLYGAPLATGPSDRDPGRVLRARQGILGALGGNGVRRAHHPTAAKREYRSFKDAVAALERDPEKVTVNTIAYPVVAEARIEAEDRMAVIGSLYKEVDGLSLLSDALSFDFKTKGMDEAFSEEELEGMSGMQATRNPVTGVIGRNPTVRDFLNIALREGARAVVGSAKDIADNPNDGCWRACDGFAVGDPHPGHLRISSAQDPRTATPRLVSPRV